MGTGAFLFPDAHNGGMNRGWVFKADAPRAVILVRFLVGGVFLSEGIQKFLFPAALGAGRFLKIGIPLPEIMAPFVGAVEVVCGALLILGLATRLATIPLIIDIGVAIATTKIPIWLASGFWAMAHEARTDYSMLAGLLFLLVSGAGRWSMDRVLAPRKVKPYTGGIG
jgi:uncharacterized membrane protein YphA (DoxX/SURF4 family)